MGWARTSPSAVGDTWMSLVVFLDNYSNGKRRDVLNHNSIYIYMNGQSSGNLAYRHWNGNSWWSGEYTFYGLSPGTTYEVNCTIDGSYGDVMYHRTSGVAGSPPTTPSFYQTGVSGTTVTMSLSGTGTATSMNYYTSWNSNWSYNNYIQSSPSFYIPTSGYNEYYQIGVQGVNSYGNGGVTYAGVYTGTYTPTIFQSSLVNNKLTVGISTQGSFYRIDVGMYDSNWNYYGVTKSITYDGTYYRTGYVTFDNLAPGSTWKFKVLSYNNAGIYGPYGNELTVTNNIAPAVPTMSHHSSNGKHITVSVGNDANTAWLYFKPSWSSSWSSYSPNEKTYTFEAPQYGTEYTIAVYAAGSGGSTSGQKIANVMTEPKVPTLKNLGIANGNLTLEVTSSGEFTQIKVEMFPYGSNVAYSTRYINWTGDTNLNTTLTFTNLVPQKSYSMMATVSKTSSYGYSPILEGGKLTVTYTIARPSNWSWYTDKSAGGIFSMSATEWNAFTTRVNQFREYKGLDRYNFTQAYPGSGFAFYMHNETKAAIDEMASTGISTVTTGSSVSASALNILRNTLNIL